MTGTIPLRPLEARAVRELADVGLGHAAAALAGLVGRRVERGAPHAESVPLEALPERLGGEALCVGIHMPIEGDLDGSVAFVLPWASAQGLWSALLGAVPGEPEEIDALHASVLCEVGNVVDGGFLAAISDATGLDLRATPPRLCADMGAAVVGAIACEAASADAATLVVRTTLTAEGMDLAGTFLFIPSAAGLRRVLRALGLPAEGA